MNPQELNALTEEYMMSRVNHMVHPTVEIVEAVKWTYQRCLSGLAKKSEEGFRPIHGFENYYVSANAEVISDTGEKLVPYFNGRGYHWVTLKNRKHKRQFSLARLVGMSFCKGFFFGAHINHVDGNKINNLPSNLEWVSAAQNVQHAYNLGLSSRGRWYKYDVGDFDKILDLKAQGMTLREISDQTGIGNDFVRLVSRGKWSREKMLARDALTRKGGSV